MMQRLRDIDEEVKQFEDLSVSQDLTPAGKSFYQASAGRKQIAQFDLIVLGADLHTSGRQRARAAVPLPHDAFARFLPHEPNIRTLKRGRERM
jgi:hypothetical protein